MIMSLLYSLGIRLYAGLIFFASLFNNKAKLWIDGRKNLLVKIKEEVNPLDQIAWFHASSLGEFEQGRPVIEAFRKKHPDYKILLTFFSPSGYEIRKNYEGADYIYYMPLDTPKNARLFIEAVRPQIAFFVKYDFWCNFLNVLNQQNIPTYIFSSIFRKEQAFFRWYGGWYRKLLSHFTHIFVQNEESKDLLADIGIEDVSISGDTRFDRVYAITQQTKDLPLIETFKQNNKILIAGSTWEKDEEIIAEYINTCKANNLKFIIAPHEIKSENIIRIENSVKGKQLLRFSNATEQTIEQADVLIIDSIGILSSLYKYGDISYIGGGFGKGIHNTLEAATFGMPILFGPNYHRFKEAVDLIEKKAAFSVNNFKSFQLLIDNLLQKDDLLIKTASISKSYVKDNLGATQVILDQISL